MSTELFTELPESPSPRLMWMRKHGLQTKLQDDGRVIAYKSGTTQSHVEMDEYFALVGLAKKLKIKTWNEEP